MELISLVARYSTVHLMFTLEKTLNCKTYTHIHMHAYTNKHTHTHACMHTHTVHMFKANYIH